MARKRKPRRRKRRPAPPARLSPSRAETDLLTLAREIGSFEHLGAAAVDAAFRRLAEAYAPESPLPPVLFDAWARSGRDKTARLALAWAREQVRLALQELLTRGVTARAVRGDVDPDVLAWLALAACEAIALEPSGAAPDRLRALMDWSRPGGLR
jgi:hypothetical protein